MHKIFITYLTENYSNYVMFGIILIAKVLLIDYFWKNKLKI